VTDQHIRYSIYFLDYSAIFEDYPGFSENVFMFNIDVIEGNPNSKPLDERIGATIVQVMNLFFRKYENVVVYVCDSLDDRQLSRKRKFDTWFWKYNDGTLLKEDDIAVVDGVEILNSMIVHKSNAHLKEIILAFKELNERASDKE
jgi:hypothetical protein